MELETLKRLINNIQSDLEYVDGERHIKAASQRVRVNLGKLKNATPAIRKYLVELDKKK